MPVIERTIEVRYHLQVHFSPNSFHPSNTTLLSVLTHTEPNKRHKALVIVDASLAKHNPSLLPQIQTYFQTHASQLHLVCPPLLIEGGEHIKNSYTPISEIHAHIERHHIDRHSYVIAIGGGALLDMAGLAAATAHRGVRHIRIPTTTLSQDDSGVGVKNGINAFGKKNFIGTFAPPFAVINDFTLLNTLPPRDRRSGYVEAVKVALIRDKTFFETIETQASQLATFQPEAMQYLIHRCAELHLNHIATSGDPFEFGSARPLDFGHWAAHKLEQLSNYQLRHGEAVAIGIAIDSIYSARIGFLPPPDASRILNLLEKLGFTLYCNELSLASPTGKPLVLDGLEEFREHLGGELTITLLKAIGQGFETHQIDPQTVLAAINDLHHRHSPLHTPTT